MQTPQAPSAPSSPAPLPWLSVFTNVFVALLNKLRLPKPAQVYVIHAAVAFVSVFVTQVVISGFHPGSWSSLWQLLVSAAAAGGSAALHYVLGLFNLNG